MGKVKTEQIKRLAKALILKYPEQFSTSFDDNKYKVKELTIEATSRVRNQVAGYITRTCTLNQRGIPEQEEEVIEDPEA